MIGSWYFNKGVSLKLEIDFHCSRKTIMASQVSKIPAELKKQGEAIRPYLGSGEKSLKPSRLITRQTLLEHAQEAYAALENGEEIAVAFDYR